MADWSRSDVRMFRSITGAPQINDNEQGVAPVVHPGPSLTVQQPLLCDSHSEPSDGKDVFEGIARATKLAMENDRFVSPDVYDATTLEYWLRSFVSHLRKAKESFEANVGATVDSQPKQVFGDSQPARVKSYLKFVAKCLLESQCFKHLDKFLRHFVAIREFVPELVPAVVQALEALAQDRPHS